MTTLPSTPRRPLLLGRHLGAPGLAALLAVCRVLSATSPAAAQLPTELTGGRQPAAEQEAPAPIAADAGPQADRAIERRLRGIYGVLEGLDGVTVEASSGVVRLGGEVLTQDDRERAVRLARQVEGVVEVEDRIAEVRDVQRRLAPAFTMLRDRALDLVDWLPLAGVALVLLLVFWVLGRWVGGRDQPFRRLAKNRFLADLLRQVARVAVVLVGAVLALEILDATALVGAVLGAAGLVGLAIGFAFRDTAENYIASVLLSVRQPFAPNDLVEIEGREGRVVRLTSRATVLMTLDGNHVRIPNAVVFKGVLTNYTRNPRRRFDFTVGVGTDVDLVAALELGRDILTAMDGVLDEPPPQAWIDALGDSWVTVHFFGWVDQRANEFAKVKSEAIRLVKEAFDAAGYDMPEPIYRLRIAGEPGAAPVAQPAGGPAAEPAAELEPGRSGRPESGRAVPEEPTRPRIVRPAPAGEPEPATAEAGEPPEPRVELDISRDTHLDREVAADRAESPGADLLDPAAPQE